MARQAISKVIKEETGTSFTGNNLNIIIIADEIAVISPAVQSARIWRRREIVEKKKKIAPQIAAEIAPCERTLRLARHTVLLLPLVSTGYPTILVIHRVIDIHRNFQWLQTCSRCTELCMFTSKSTRPQRFTRPLHLFNAW